MSALAEPTALASDLDRDTVLRAPKVLLHDHLDGGLRPRTIVELAAESGHVLPADDADALRRWFEEPVVDGSIDEVVEVAQEAGTAVGSAQTGFLRSYALAIALSVAVMVVVFVSVR